jgi:hypothetical protein
MLMDIYLITATRTFYQGTVESEFYDPSRSPLSEEDGHFIATRRDGKVSDPFTRNDSRIWFGA